MIEKGKEYYISVKEDGSLAKMLVHTPDVNLNRLVGTIEHVHAFGFLFKLDKENFPKMATLNVHWEELRFIYTEEDV